MPHGGYCVALTGWCVMTQSAVRGVSNAGTPGLAYTFLLKLFLMCLTRPQIKLMLGARSFHYFYI